MDEVKRMNYYNGLFLKEDDFITEQNYNIRMRRLMNWYLNRVYGILEGLDVKPLEGKKYKITPGIAISNIGEGKWYGTEIVFSSEYPLDLSNKPPGDYYITITYDEVKGDDDTSKGSDKIHWIERPKPDIQSKLPDSPEKEIVLAKINVPAGDWTSNVKYLNFDDRKEIGPALRCINDKAVVGTPNQSATLEINGDIKAKNTELQNLSVQENVGIGTPNPDPDIGLHIDRGNKNSPALQLSSSSAGWGSGVLFKNSANTESKYGIYVGQDQLFRICDGIAGQDRLIIHPNGNIGIGTYNPSARLEVDGDIKCKTNLIIDGNIGIGTIDPKDKLDVNGNIRLSGKLAFQGSDDYLRINQNNEFPKGTVFSHRTNFYRGITTGTWWDEEPGVGNILIDGNIGIGTKIPRASLHVEATDKPTIMADSECGGLVSGSNGGNGVFGTNIYMDSSNKLKTAGTHDGNYGYAGMHVTWGNINFYAANANTTKNDIINPSQRLFIRGSDGNVGIGTDKPNAKLDVQGDIHLSGSIIQDPWIPAELQNGWKEYGHGFNSPGYFLDKSGIVHLRGLLTGGGFGPNVFIFVLPEGYRPANRELHLVASSTGYSGLGRCDITKEGEVIAVEGVPNWFSLDGITFRAR